MHYLVCVHTTAAQLVNKDAKKEQEQLDHVLAEIRDFGESNREAVEAKRRALERRQKEAQRCVLHASARRWPRVTARGAHCLHPSPSTS